MDSPSDSESQLLVETYLEPLTRSSPTGIRDSDSELGEDACSVEQELGDVLKSENMTRLVARRKLLVACAVSLVFMTGEAIGGYVAHSLAIMTDAAHLLTDFGSIVISIFSLEVSSRPQTQTMTFGWHRAEILGMFLSIVSVWAVTVVLVFSAVQRIAEGDYDIDGQIMLVTSACAVVVNVLMVLILHQSGASHGHNHGVPIAQRDKRTRGRCHSNASVKAAFVHVLGDLLQSVGVLLAASIIHFWMKMRIHRSSSGRQRSSFVPSLVSPASQSKWSDARLHLKDDSDWLLPLWHPTAAGFKKWKDYCGCPYAKSCVRYLEYA
ncbi:zinc transporter 2-like isoform X2 [Poecilia reticulata]|uniref:zinc transporter 2-like isoform X2 n=1 Tax=Poecilia reticulata TaxID=8081 RepID=UPI0007EAD302|nr:PREDICTED: zinc transporter 2-like isoform X2 [Poecilia reticulata]